MKQVLIIDAPSLFQDFLKEKFISEQIQVETAEGNRDAFTKIVTTLPDLIILDISSTLKASLELLEKKRNDPNARTIPVIMTGPTLSRAQLAILAQYNVLKYFNKPIKYDIFFESVGKILDIDFIIDDTPCIMEIHLTNNIIFIEISQSLNREKIGLLKFKIAEIINQNNLTTPKVVLMLTGLPLNFVDAINLELLLDNIIADERIFKRNIKILSLDSFIRDLIQGHKEYSGIEVVNDLSNVLNAIVDAPTTQNSREVILNKVLTPTEDVSTSSVLMKFASERDASKQSEFAETDINMEIAIVDDDPVTRTLLEKIYQSINAKVQIFNSGSEFLAATSNKVYNLIILDIFMPGISGFDILNHLHNKGYPTPIIIYSNATSRDYVIQALSLGAKSYLVKPLKPEVLLQKSLEIMNSNV
ncbi:MAG: response regulator [Spirochaetaceae bacterium]|nr:response regulator [Spirochaetaceae bacterium]